MIGANFAPIYCGLYPELASLVREHGYALAVHGSLARDFDLVCIPWVDEPSNHAAVVDAIVAKFALRTVGEYETKAHGRIVYTISVSYGECFLDLSFVPLL